MSAQPSSMPLSGELLAQLLRNQPDCDAVFSCNDDLAQGGLLALMRGEKPEHKSVDLGFGLRVRISS